MSQTIEMIDPVTGEIIDQQQIAEQLLAQVKEQGVSLVGPGVGRPLHSVRSLCESSVSS